MSCDVEALVILRSLESRTSWWSQPKGICSRGISTAKRRLPPQQARQYLHIENRELLTGDCLLLVAFCLYKQVRWHSDTHCNISVYLHAH